MERKPRHLGFTLIELLVVITIIALLIAILLPTLIHARTTVKMLICSSNLRQVGIGVFTYCADNEDWYPNGHIPNGIAGLNADGKYGRDHDYSWAVYQTGSYNHDMVAILADYYHGVDGMRDTYMCGFMEEGYRKNMRETDKLWNGTNSGQQTFSLMWNIQGRDQWDVKQGMYRLGDRWQQGIRYQNYDDMWYNLVAGDRISWDVYGGARANHYNQGRPTPFMGYGFELEVDEPTNGNFLADDGSVLNHNNMQRDQPHVGGTGHYMVPGSYATAGP